MGAGTHGEIGQVDGCPGNVLGHTGYGVDGKLSGRNEDDMDHPCAYSSKKVTMNSSGWYLENAPLRLTHSALILGYAAWSRASSFELSTCSTLR